MCTFGEPPTVWPITSPQDHPVRALRQEHSLIWMLWAKLPLVPKFFFLIGRNLSLFWVQSELLCTTWACASYSTWPVPPAYLPPHERMESLNAAQEGSMRSITLLQLSRGTHLQWETSVHYRHWLAAFLPSVIKVVFTLWNCYMYIKVLFQPVPLGNSKSIEDVVG